MYMCVYIYIYIYIYIYVYIYVYIYIYIYVVDNIILLTLTVLSTRIYGIIIGEYILILIIPSMQDAHNFIAFLHGAKLKVCGVMSHHTRHTFGS